MAYDLREIHQASWSEAVFTDGDANKRILDALLGAKEGGENILISVYTDTKRRARRQLWGVWTLASGFISIVFEKIATL